MSENTPTQGVHSNVSLGFLDRTITAIYDTMTTLHEDGPYEHMSQRFRLTARVSGLENAREELQKKLEGQG